MKVLIEGLFYSKYGTWLMMLGVIFIIVGILRFLFGPRGIFRDQEWDCNNEQIRREERERWETKCKTWEEEQKNSTLK